MKYTLRFATRHPRYCHTMILRRLGPGRWEVESFSNDPRDYERKVGTRADAIFGARLSRETARRDVALHTEGRPGAWRP